jgi:stearoyl-CoA desaturase (delta-9 desaturase)
MKTEWKHRILLSLAWASIPFAIWYCISIGDWTLFWTSYLIAQFNKVIGNNISFHRYFTHRNFQTTPFKHKLLALWPILLASKSPIAYAMNHRHHHMYAEMENDTHSPVRSFWHTITGFWEFRSYQWFANKGVEYRVKDLIRDPMLKFVERHYFKFWYVIAVVTLLIDWRFFVFGFLLPAGHYHLMANLVVVGMDHLKMPGSYRTYDTPDNSYNNQFLAWISMGEGFHNNHHQDASKYDQGFNKWEFDICAWFIDKFFIIKDKNTKPYIF